MTRSSRRNQQWRHDAPLRVLSVLTAPEAEEAVAELLLRLTGELAVMTQSRVTGMSTVAVYLRGAATRCPTSRQELRVGLQEIAACGLAIGPARISWRRVPQRDWAESWKRHFTPLSIGGALLVRPSWSRKRPVRGQVELVLDPGLSFGTGQHPTTEFCLQELVRLRPRGGKLAFLDVGTGSGILACAAAKLAYAPVEAFDFDPEAVAIARRNAEFNGVARGVRTVRRDVARLRVPARRLVDVVAANLTADLLQRHAAALVGQVRPGGQLILAGILDEQFAEVRRTFEALGLKVTRSIRRGEWRSGSFLKVAPGSATPRPGKAAPVGSRGRKARRAGRRVTLAK